MFKKLLIFVLLCWIPFVYWATGDNIDFKNQLEVQNKQIEDLRTENRNLEYKIKDQFYEYYNKTIDSANSINDKWLSIQSNILAFFSIIVAVVWILLFYVNIIFNKIKTNKEEVDRVLDETKKIKEYVDNNPWIIYEKILEEETRYIFERLENNPEHILNFFSKLTTRKKLDFKYFEKLKNLYLNSVIQKKWNYLILLLQYFFCNVFLEEDLWNAFINHPTIIRSFFKKEAEDISFEISHVFISNNLYEDEKCRLRLSDFFKKLFKNRQFGDENKILLKNEVIKIFEKENKKEIIDKILSDNNLV